MIKGAYDVAYIPSGITTKELVQLLLSLGDGYFIRVDDDHMVLVKEAS
jgi:hypothetical protein